MKNKPISQLAYAIIVVAILLVNLEAKAQSIQLLLDPVIQNNNQGIMNLSLINNSENAGNVKLLASLKTRRGKLLLKQEILVPINAREVLRVDEGAVQTLYIEDNFSKVYEAGKMLPPYDYVLCVNASFLGDIGNQTEECIEYLASDFLALIPAYPPNEEIIYQAQPVFTWINTSADYPYTYDFSLVKKDPQQNPNAAIRRNNPLVQLENLSESNVFYPADAPVLENGAAYVWQLDIKINGEEVAKSDAYTFIYKEGEEIFDIPRDLSYVDIREIPSGAELFAVGVFKFRYDAKVSGDFQVKLYDVKREKPVRVEKEHLSYKLGTNKYDYDLKEQVYLRHLNIYRLELIDKSSKQVYQFKVKYVNPDYIK